MTRALRLPAAVTTAAVLAVIAAGCSGHQAAGSASTQTAHEQSVKFAECMRTNGVRTFPDPTATGALTLDGVLNGSGLDQDSPTWTRGIAACRHLEPAGFTGTTVTSSQMAARLKFAQCVRTHGVSDFPDPSANEPLVDTDLIPSVNTPGGRAALQAALKACQSELAGTGVSRP
ncbi:MAG TPA: hypothetical protein VMH41_08990 [Mycobacteriales bacterium]|nr:hypothetical protein [Mycobacteriales bacterium]